MALHCTWQHEEPNELCQAQIQHSTGVHYRKWQVQRQIKLLSLQIFCLVISLTFAPLAFLTLITIEKQETNETPVDLGMDDSNSPFISLENALKDAKRIKYHNDYLTNLAASIRYYSFILNSHQINTKARAECNPSYEKKKDLLIQCSPLTMQGGWLRC